VSANNSNGRPSQTANQRRSQRVLVAIPVVISGNHENGLAFTERTTTAVVSAHGALILLYEPTRMGQTLQLKNLATGEQLSCTVVDMNPGQGGASEIGVEFSAPSPRFWRVSFLPMDWSSRSPEAKR
jgi:hypothetical protein